MKDIPFPSLIVYLLSTNATSFVLQALSWLALSLSAIPPNNILIFNFIAVLILR
jgi:hypothetical protein